MLPSLPPPERQLAGEIEPWRCDSCGHLMYNVDANGCPIPGAPMPHYWSVSKPCVCAACYQMVLPLATSEYWKAAHNEWRLEEARLQDAKDRQTGKRDYFTGM